MEADNKVIITYSGSLPNQREQLYSYTTEEIKEITSNEEGTINRRVEEVFDLAYYKSDTIQKLPFKYLECLKQGKSFEIDIIHTTRITYKNESNNK